MCLHRYIFFVCMCLLPLFCIYLLHVIVVVVEPLWSGAPGGGGCGRAAPWDGGGGEGRGGGGQSTPISDLGTPRNMPQNSHERAVKRYVVQKRTSPGGFDVPSPLCFMGALLSSSRMFLGWACVARRRSVAYVLQRGVRCSGMVGHA